MSSSVTPVELNAAFSGPAVLANRFFITKIGSLVRISFTEEPPNSGPIFRTAVVLSQQDANDLAAVISGLLGADKQSDNPSGNT
jgi:hypothetical protein